MRKQYQLREDLSDIAEMSDHEVSINSGFIREVANEANCYMGYYHQAKETIHRQGKTAHRLKTRIKALEEQLETTRSQLKHVQMEKEAAERDITRCCGTCLYHREPYNGHDFECINPIDCFNVSGTNTGWEWRGPCTENTNEKGTNT